MMGRLTILKRKRILTDLGKGIGIVLLGVLLLALLFSFTFRPRSIHAPVSSRENGDKAHVHYTAWRSDANRTVLPGNLLFNDSVWLTVVPITEDNRSGLILGLYDALIGEEAGFRSDKIFLERCIDRDLDGFDDHTGEAALTYGHRVIGILIPPWASKWPCSRSRKSP